MRCNSGQQSRELAISNFKDRRQNYRVLILSSVGNAGLNLHEARFMLFAVSVDNLCKINTDSKIIRIPYGQDRLKSRLLDACTASRILNNVWFTFLA